VEDIGERLREKGWKQGVIVPARLILKKLADGSPATNNDYAMIVTQSCDLVHHNLQNEPSAVLLIMKSISASDSGLMHGRNPRVLHVQSSCGTWLETWAWNQVVIPRDHLAEKDATNKIELAPKDLRLVLDWLAKRFTRIAFPDGFNDLLKTKANAIGKLLKSNHALFSEILLYVTPFEDLNHGEHYELACYLLMASDVHDDSEQLTKARSVATKLEKLFTECGIDVSECSPVSEAVITLAELNELVHWDFDYLTHRASADT